MEYFFMAKNFLNSFASITSKSFQFLLFISCCLVYMYYLTRKSLSSLFSLAQCSWINRAIILCLILKIRGLGQRVMNCLRKGMLEKSRHRRRGFRRRHSTFRRVHGPQSWKLDCLGRSNWQSGRFSLVICTLFLWYISLLSSYNWRYTLTASIRDLFLLPMLSKQRMLGGAYPSPTKQGRLTTRMEIQCMGKLIGNTRMFFSKMLVFFVHLRSFEAFTMIFSVNSLGITSLMLSNFFQLVMQSPNSLVMKQVLQRKVWFLVFSSIMLSITSLRQKEMHSPFRYLGGLMFSRSERVSRSFPISNCLNSRGISIFSAMIFSKSSTFFSNTFF